MSSHRKSNVFVSKTRIFYKVIEFSKNEKSSSKFEGWPESFILTLCPGNIFSLE